MMEFLILTLVVALGVLLANYASSLGQPQMLGLVFLLLVILVLMIFLNRPSLLPLR